MAHRVITDTDIFPRMNRDVARHRQKMRQAIQKNLQSVVANESIITTEKGKVVRVPIRQLREWRFAYEDSEPMVGHGDGRRKVPCPACGGKGCKLCGEVGIVTSRRAKRIRDWIFDQQNGPTSFATSFSADSALISAAAQSQQDEEEKEQEEEERRRRGNTGRPRSKAGDRIYHESSGQGSGAQADDRPGVDIYETEVSLEELQDIVFEALNLPLLDDRGKRKIKSEVQEFDEIRKAGPLSSVEKKRTIRANMMRNAKEMGKPVIFKIAREDLRYRTWEIEEEEEAAAVVFALMDSSGSMDEFKKFVCRTFFAWMTRFLRTQYNQVQIVFIAHDIQAKEVTEDDFFHKMQDGGTHLSSAWKKALNIMKERYSPSDWNIYVYHFSDGENWPNDNDDFLSSVRSVLDYPVNMAGYAEVTATDPDNPMPFWWGSPTAIKEILEKAFAGENRLVITKIDKQEDIWPALQTFFLRDSQTGKALKDITSPPADGGN